MTAEVGDRVQAMVNDSLSLQCKVTANPAAGVVWMKDSLPLRMGEQRFQVQSSGDVLNITEVKVSDRGKYTCIASNEAGTAEKDFYVSTLVPPKIEGPDVVNVQVVENRGLTLECHVESQPRATVYWTRNGLPYE